jgi:(3R)-3-[(carboxylmethyl)amino]fatty acid synthase
VTSGSLLETYAPDAVMLRRVLRPYRESCFYLQAAEVRKSPGQAQAHGRFSIAESCYIDDTGHFNAVEFNICYNQLGYYLLATCVDRTLFEALAPWTLDDFWQHQLSDVLIYDFGSRFRRMINPREFEGTVTFEEPRVVTRPGKAPVLFMPTTVAFWDDRGGAADGSVKLALTNVSS